MEQTVLMYLERNDEYLLLLRNKKKNDMNANKWIGIGGHIEKDETPEQALIRETKEETNLDLHSFKKHGEILFRCDGYEQIMHLYTSSDFSGEIKECNEGTLSWKKKNEIKDLPIWEGDKVFLEYLLKGEPYFKITLEYARDELVTVERTL